MSDTRERSAGYLAGNLNVHRVDRLFAVPDGEPQLGHAGRELEVRVGISALDRDPGLPNGELAFGILHGHLGYAFNVFGQFKGDIDARAEFLVHLCADVEVHDSGGVALETDGLPWSNSHQHRAYTRNQ